MKHKDYLKLEEYMHRCMADSAHDREHVYRVLYSALMLAEAEHPDYDVLIAACLLHDIGRQEQFADPTLCHAQVGGEKAYRFLRKEGFPEAVLIRGVEGYNGPGKLTKALQIDRSLNGADLAESEELWIEDDGTRLSYHADKRVGIDYATPKYREILWRYLADGVGYKGAK